MSDITANDVTVIGAGRLMEFLGDDVVLKKIAAEFGSERVEIQMSADLTIASVSYIFNEPEQADPGAIADRLRDQTGGTVEASEALGNVNVTVRYD